MTIIHYLAPEFTSVKTTLEKGASVLSSNERQKEGEPFRKETSRPSTEDTEEDE